MKTLIDELDEYKFECEAGPLEKANPFVKLVKKTDLWVVLKRGQIVSHTSGKGGWNFLVYTNEAEAQAMADEWNETRYSGSREKVCTVRHLLAKEDVTEDHPKK